MWIQDLSEAIGIPLALLDREPGGEQGAWKVADSAETEYILKIHPDPDRAIQFDFAAATTAQLWELAYPAPRYFATGIAGQLSYALIEKLPGDPDRPLTPPLLDQLIALNRMQHGQAGYANRDWVTGMVDSVMKGRSGYCEVGTLRNHSYETADLLRQIQSTASGCQRLEVACDDVVHFDYNPANVLTQGDQVTGIIDWEGTCTGDSSFDLATLLFYCWDDVSLRPRLTEAIVERSGKDALGLYLCHMMLRQIDWSIRHHDHATVAHYLQRADRILLE